MEAKAYWSLSGQGITVPQIIASSGLDAKRVKMAEKTQKNGKESCKKILVKQRKHYLSLAGKSFKNQENIKQKWEARDID